MAYIGNTPADKFLTLAKQNFSTSATTSYTLDSAVSGTQDIALFINNVRQSPVDAYSVSGTALTLTSATAGTDEMYCVYLGKTVGTVSPASDSVTTAMLQANAVTGAKLNTDVISAQTALGATPADTDELLVSDAGVLKRVDYSYIKGALNTPIIQVYLNANQSLTNGQFDKITFDQETYDTGSNFASNKFTVPSDGGGYYYIELKVDFDYGTEVPNDKKCKIVLGGSTDLSEGFMNGDGHPYGTVSCSTIVNLSATNYIEGFAYVQNGTASFAKSGSAYTQMKIFKLGS